MSYEENSTQFEKKVNKFNHKFDCLLLELN